MKDRLGSVLGGKAPGKRRTRTIQVSLEMSGKPGGFDRSMQHHLINLRFKDGVYEALETIETLSHPESRDLEPLEVWAVVKGNRPRLWQAV